MDSDKKLIELREKLVSELGIVAEDSILDPAQKFSLLMLRARNTGSSDLMAKAAEVAHQIEDPEEKTNALLDLIEEIDFTLDNARNQQAILDQEPVDEVQTANS